MELGLTCTSQQEWTVLAVSGELDMASAPRFRQAVQEVIADCAVQQRAPEVVIDLTAVDFMDSTGIGVLMGATKRVRSAGGEVRLVAHQQWLLELFHLTRLDRIFEVCESVETATAQSGTQ